MEYIHTLRWTDPYETWGDHDNAYYNSRFVESKTRGDTGFGNRLLHWEIGYTLLNMIPGDNKALLVQKKIWPELELIDLPNTIGISLSERYGEFQCKYEYDSLYLRTVMDVKTNEVSLAKPITETKLMSLIRKNTFSMKSGKHWYSNFGYHSMRSVITKINESLEAVDTIEWDEFDRPFCKIKLKHAFIRDLLEEKMPSFVGIHIRRGNGVTIHDIEYDEVPPSIADDFIKWRKENCQVQDEGYRFYSDNVYFKIMDLILKINPKQQFYISHDMPDRFMLPFYERYGKLVETKKEPRHFYDVYYSQAGLDVAKLNNFGNSIENVTDMFALANCGMIISSPGSSWSDFAIKYKNTPYHEPFDNENNIVKGYKNAFDVINKSNII